MDEAACRLESATTKVWGYTPGVFRDRFVSPYEQYRDRIGRRFTVIRTWTLKEVADECGVAEEEAGDMYDIRFEDGAQIVAWGEEVCVVDPSLRVGPEGDE